MAEPDPEASSSTATSEPTDTDSYPIAARIPPTILTQVFELLRHDNEREGSLEWLAVSHVCQHWRTQALGHQALWSYLNPAILSRGLVDDFLQRSGSAPLDITVDVVSDRDDHSIRQAYRKILTNELPRVRTLVYAYTNTERQLIPVAEELALLLKGPAPLLHTLRLPGIKRSRLLFREARALLNFLADHAPAIQELELGRFPPGCFPWGSPPSAIRTLVLWADNSIEGVLSVSFTQLLGGLRAMPSLEILSLSGVVPKHTSNAPIQDTVHLPHLQKLRLTGSGEQYALLWHAIKTHPECATQIEIVRTANFPEILPVALEKYCTECNVSALTELYVKRNASHGIVCDMFPVGQPPDEWAYPSQPYTHPYLSIFVAWENMVKVASHMPAMQIFGTLPLHNVKRMTSTAVDAAPARTEPERLARLGKRVNKVEEFTLVAFRPSQLSSMFLIMGGTLLPPSGEVDDFDLPRLRTLTMKDCRFDRDVAAPALRDTLERRVTYGIHPLEVLSFVGCGLDSEMIAELELEFVETGLVNRILCDDARPMSPITD